jgi:protein TonB
MKRFVLISIFLHAVVLALLFSWGIPMADRLLPRSIVEVSLIDRIEGKKGGQEKSAEKKPEKKSGKRVNIQEQKDTGATRHAPGVIPPSKEELKIEEPKPEKIDPAPREAREEEPKPEEKTSPAPPVLKARSEETPIQQAGPTPPGAESEESKQSVSPLNISPSPGGRGDGGAVFFAAAGPESGKGGIPLAVGGQGSGTGKGQGESLRFGSVPRTSGDGDSVVSEILRRIEKAKRYPRTARKMGTEGQATVRFRIKTDGKVEGVELMDSSGSEILDQASLETVQRAAPLPYKDGWLKVVIVFKIL